LSISKIAQILGTGTVYFCADCPLTKCHNLCYNGDLARGGRPRATEIKVKREVRAAARTFYHFAFFSFCKAFYYTLSAFFF